MRRNAEETVPERKMGARISSRAIRLLALLVFPVPLLAAEDDARAPGRPAAEAKLLESVIGRVDGLVGDLDTSALGVVQRHAAPSRQALARIEAEQERLLRRFDGPVPPTAAPPAPAPIATPTPTPTPTPMATTPTLQPKAVSLPDAAPLSAGDRQVLVSEAVQTFGKSLDEAARTHDLEPGFLLCVMNVESAFKPDARSSAGAVGLLQLMPSTAADLGANPWDIRQNILAGAGLIDAHLRRYREDVSLAMAAYNAGPGAVDRFNGIPPYSETRGYVARIARECGAPRPRPTTSGNVADRTDRGTR